MRNADYARRHVEHLSFKIQDAFTPKLIILVLLVFTRFNALDSHLIRDDNTL